MTIAAVALLAATAVFGAVLWYVVDRHRDQIGSGTAVWAASIPALLLGAAALLALAGSPAGGTAVGIARATAVVAAVPGGWLLATAVLRMADRAPGEAGGRQPGRERPGTPAPRAGWASARDEPTPASAAAADAPDAVPAPPPPPAMPAPPLSTTLPTASPLPGPSRTSPATAWQGFSDPTTLRGGTTIGVLERVAVVVTLLAGWPEGLALILAIKGFGRYPELRKPSAPERFIVGTFASVLWAVAVVGVVVALDS